uniref:Uncharacterized protein n=1 Tax=Rhizophora mucronata TaxID=61149 RepID=A0A2P2QFK3_RHIMU
MHEYPPLMF